jgi:2-methylisocitrate lyase-like PEP mutase family enzyme
MTSQRDVAASVGRRLRELIHADRLAVLPGASSAVMAKLVEQAGFPAAYMTGYGASLTVLGLPDVGLGTMTETVANAGDIARAVKIPLLADADTGYGNALNVRRTVEAFIRAGVAGIHLEDQVSPKRCGGIAGREVISCNEMVGKLRAALDARAEFSSDFVIIARTDAIGATNGGVDDAIRRGCAYLDAGADAVMTADAAVDSMDIVRRFARGVRGPYLFAASRLRMLPTHEELAEAGVAGVIYPLETTVIAAVTDWEFLRDFRARGAVALRDWSAKRRGEPMTTVDGIHALAGFPEALARLERYLPGTSTAAAQEKA